MSRGAVAEIDDRRAAALLLSMALMEIRYLSRSARRENGEASPGDDLERIWFLADLCHNLPGVAQPPTRRNRPLGSRERAMAERPMSWTWNTAGREGRAWITAQLDQVGHSWTPPPPLPDARTGPPERTLWQRLGLWRRDREID
ncbi:hypothetical protein Aph01nite_09940 [Acrocarpospora phusangensis]|uniref:Uncharacterized protein n=1 Tax=Acrocarpospora phusangensis TaxID=1070424 RepID=A0A919UI23_9ACTN|nr:hypothetical protein [Acrocarpospora phusangensis]GIH22684.1 hypothetical protein Aph01nite_09940 [Acrocarpospora phusangensis]